VRVDDFVSDLFSSKARWLWTTGDRYSYNQYVRFRRDFDVNRDQTSPEKNSFLLITADALYQVWVNGTCVGHGPAKSAEGRRSVDRFDVTHLVQVGHNRVEILVLSIGVGTMTYCPGEAGLIFELNIGGKLIVSDEQTECAPDQSRRSDTVRRWMLPCLEEVDAAGRSLKFKPATVVQSSAALYLRRVPLPVREPLSPQRIVSRELVTLPNFSVSFRVRPYLTDERNRGRNNLIDTPAFLVVDLISPTDQEITFVPTLGNMSWYSGNRLLFEGSGWTGWEPAKSRPTIRLRKGANRLVGVHESSHFEDVSLCAFVKDPIIVQNPFGAGAFQIVPSDNIPRRVANDPAAPTKADRINARGRLDLTKIDWSAYPLPRMDPRDSMVFGNAFDLAFNAKVTATLPFETGNVLSFNATEGNAAERVIVDLGLVHNGWISFDARGPSEGRFLFAFFEALIEGPPRRIQWPVGANNAFTYYLRSGRQRFESFLTYGARYIAIYYSGTAPATVDILRLHTAFCGGPRVGSFLSSDPMLNGIYEITAQSPASASDDTFNDCPTYEQVNWNFDNRIAALVDSLTSGNRSLAANSLALFAEDPAFSGLVRSQYPSTWDNIIPLWSFHWILACRDHYWQCGDAPFVRQMFPRIEASIAEALGRIGERGLLDWSGPELWHYVEWGHGRDDAHAIVTGEQALLLGALAAADELASVANAGNALRRGWRAAAEGLRSAIDRELWDETRDAFVDSIHEDGKRSTVASQVSNAALALYGAGSESWRRRLTASLVNGSSKLLSYGSPSGVYYILELLDLYGERDAIFGILRSRWGDMVLAGDSCTWEHFAEFGFAGYPTRSRCHPYSSYVVKYLVKYLLGIEAVEPGFSAVRFKPNPPDSLDHCSGSIPTPHGIVRSSWFRKGGKRKSHIEVPIRVRVVR
jgi:alpha-L-rhamnosidase